MRLTPNEIADKQFTRSRGGYDASEVDEFLRVAASSSEQTLLEMTALQERMEILEREVERFQALESTLKEALVLAQITANDTRALAQREAEAILRDAQINADSLTRDAVHRTETLRQERLRFGWEFRALLQSQIDHLDIELQRSATSGDSSSYRLPEEPHSAPPLDASLEQPTAQSPAEVPPQDSRPFTAATVELDATS